MNGNTEILNFIFQNSQMGVDTIKQLLGIVEDENFKKHLESQFEEYKQIHLAAQKALKKTDKMKKVLAHWIK